MENARATELPAPGSLFEPLAATLQDAPRILLFGCESGKARERDSFRAWRRTPPPEWAGARRHPGHGGGVLGQHAA